METILTSIITGIVALAVSIITNRTERRKIGATHQESLALVQYKIEELSKKVDKHNQVVERTYALEMATSILEEKQKVANNRIADLEAKVD